MFLDEYYFGNTRLINTVRMLGGPLLLTIGISLWVMPLSRVAVAYAGICIFYGVYYSFKPWIWIYFREEDFRTIQVNIQVNEEVIRLVDDASEAEFRLDALRRIIRRKSYFILEIAKSTKMFLPFSLLSDNQILALDGKARERQAPLQVRSSGNLI